MQKQHPIATWNQEKDYWEEEQVDIFGHSVAYSVTLPKSGMTRRGRLYERQTLALPTTEPECSSSPTPHFPTPAASDGNGGKAGKHVGGFRPSGTKRSVQLTDLPKMLPTPAASDWKRDDHPADRKRKSPGITTVSVHFPTPSARDGVSGGGQHPAKRRAGGHAVNLTDAVMTFTGETMPPLFDVGSV